MSTSYSVNKRGRRHSLMGVQGNTSLEPLSQFSVNDSFKAECFFVLLLKLNSCGTVGRSSRLVIAELLVRFPVPTDHMPSTL